MIVTLRTQRIRTLEQVRAFLGIEQVTRFEQTRALERIAGQLMVPVSTVTPEVKRLSLSRPSSLAPSEPVVRYERSRSGSLVRMDNRKLARIVRPGHRIDGDRSKTFKGAARSPPYLA